MQRYFLKDKVGNQLIFYDQDLHHIKNVMRFKKNDKIEIVWNNTVYLCNIDNLEPFSTSILEELNEQSNLNIELIIAISLVQEQKFDLILQKLTELGVSKIIPIKTEHSIVKIDLQKLSKKYERWNKICKEASEQSHRKDIPIITNIKTIKELALYESPLKLICSLTNESKLLNTYLKNDVKKVLFVIGPEGGLTKQEEKLLIDNSFLPISLGKRILRVETATIYVASIINYIYGG